MTVENLAILFTDVVSSTELSQRLSPEGADEVRRRHFSVLRQAIAEAGGTEVKNLGDGLMVVFTSASAALACGVAMQQGVERDSRDWEHVVDLRVGMSGGELSREDDDYFGDPVVEAARLCAICEGGQVLATEWVRLTAGRRNRHECRSLGELTLKGLSDPVQTVEVLWEPLGWAATGISIPLPSRLAVRPAVGVVGRDAELQMLIDAVKRVGAGDGREVVLVSGEAGLGKTTLVTEAARAAFEAGACVLFGHCEEDLVAPYQLFGEAIGHFVTHAPEDQLLAHVGAYGSELSRLAPALASRIPDLSPSTATDSDTERFLLFAAVVGLLTTVSARQPVVIVLDDLQWADKGSLLLLRHLVSAEQAMRVLVLGSFRDNELSRAHPLTNALAALHRIGGVSRVELVGLDDTGVVAFMEAAAGHTLDDAGVGLAHAVYRETDGNPYFVSEVLRHLTESGAIYQDETGRWTSETILEQVALPDSVREVIGARVGRLGQAAERVLSMAAVIGRDFDLAVLARVTKMADDELLDILEAAAAVALVREPADASGRYNFAHALIQHTLYEDLGPNRRAVAHRQVAEALEDLCGDRPGARVGELARHWTSATQPIDVSKAISYSRQAGDAALAALAPAEALGYFARALDLYGEASALDPALDVDLLIGLGTAQRQTGDPTFRTTLLDASHRADRVGDTKRLVAAALANYRGLVSTSGLIDADKVEVLEMALDRVSADSPDRALVLATLCSELTTGSTLERRQALAEEAISIARTFGDDAVVVQVLNRLFFPLLVPSLLEMMLDLSLDALDRAEQIGDPVLLFWAAAWRADSVARAGDIDEMDRCLEIQELQAKRLNEPTLSWGYALQVALRALIAGETDRAEQFAMEALQIGSEGGVPDAAVIFAGQHSMVSFQRGTLGEMVPLIEGLFAAAPEIAGTLTAALSMCHAEADRLEDARRLLQTFAADDFNLPMDMQWLDGMLFYAEGAIQCREPGYAMPLFDRLAPWADQCAVTGPTLLGPVSHYLGGLATVSGRYAEADAYFSQSAAMSAQMHAKFFAARTDLQWGTMLTERRAPGDAANARDLLVRAQTAAVANGYLTIGRRAADMLLQLDDR